MNNLYGWVMSGYFILELHVLHNDYPLAPEKHAILYDMFSDYRKKIADKYEIKVGDVKKLIPNLCKKTNYVVHEKSSVAFVFRNEID